MRIGGAEGKYGGLKEGVERGDLICSGGGGGGGGPGGGGGESLRERGEATNCSSQHELSLRTLPVRQNEFTRPVRILKLGRALEDSRPPSCEPIEMSEFSNVIRVPPR